MPGVTPQQYSPEDTISLISERAKLLEAEGKPALFEIMLNRRDKASGFPQNIASLTGATLEHIQDAMRWVPMLCGGGEYSLNVRHTSMPGRIGGPYPFSCTTDGPGMQPHAPNPMVTLRADWAGPKLVMPAPPDPATLNQPQHTNGAVATTSVQTGYGMPQFPQPVPTPTPTSDRERELSQQLADMKANQARLEAESKAAQALDAVKRDAEARIREAEMRAADMRREADQRMRDLESKFTALSQAAATPPPPKTDVLQMISTIFNMFSPFITQILTSMHESRQLTLKMSEEQNRKQLEANEKQHQATLELMRAVQQKPGMSDEMKLLIETLKGQANSNGGEAMAGLMARMAEAMGTVTKSSIAMVETTVDALGGEPDHPAVIAIREGTQALKALMAGNQSAVQKTIKPQLPAGQRQPPPPQKPQAPAQRLTAQEVQVINEMRRRAAAEAGRQVPQKPPPPPPQQAPVQPQQVQPQGGIKVEKVTPGAAQTATGAPTGVPPLAPAAPEPTTPPATVIEFQPAPAAPEPAASAPGFTAEGFAEAQPGTGLSHFQVLSAGVSAMKDPEQVASYFIDLAKTEEASVKAALDQHGGSPFELLVAVVGGPFIAANQGYFKTLGQLIDEKGTEAGLWKEASEDDVAADEAEEAEIAPEPTEPTPT